MNLNFYPEFDGVRSEKFALSCKKSRILLIFKQNNNVFMEENSTFKKYQFWEKVYISTISCEFCHF